MEKITKTFVSEIKGIDEKSFTVDAVISDETIDRYGEIISIDAWKKRLKRYKEHAVLLSSHRYDKLTNQIGEATKVSTEDGKLVAKFKYYVGEGNEEADWGWKLASKFGKAAYSVGFLPYDYEEGEWDEDTKKGKKARRTYTDVELVEVSQVLVPANPSALQKSLEGEEDEVLKEYTSMVIKELETKPDTENYFHIPVPGEEGKHSEHKIRTVTISSSQGIKAHYCVTCKKTTGYMFDTSKWSKAEAEKWVKEHSKDFDGVTEKELDNIGEKDLFWYVEEKKKDSCKTLEEEEMKEILEAIATLKEYIDTKFEKVDKYIEKEEKEAVELQKAMDEAKEQKDKEDLEKKDKEDLEKKEKEDKDKEDLEKKDKEALEASNYIKTLLEDTNALMAKISVQSKQD